MARGTVVVNGRFLAARQTGVQRVARQLLVHALDAGLEAEVLVPPGVDDPLAGRIVPAPPGRAGAHLWEQLVLPVASRGRVVVSLANTAPVVVRRAVVLVHDIAFDVRPQWFSPEMRLYGKLTLAAARRADRVVTVSEQVAEELTRSGVAAARIRVIPNAVAEQFSPSAPENVAAVRKRFGLHHPYVIMIGWADPRKDLSTALAACRRIRSTHPHDLVLVGGKHRNFADVEAPDEPGVRVLGYLDDELLPPLLTGAAALVYPSLYEGFGLPPLEAMACGTPAIVSDLPSVAEATGGAAIALIPQDVDGWAAAIARALRGELSVGSPQRRTWAQAGREFYDVVCEAMEGSSP